MLTIELLSLTSYCSSPIYITWVLFSFDIDINAVNRNYINVVNNISVDCDCVANPEAPCMKDIGILASLDPVALDQACLDLIYNSDDPGKDHFIERVESRKGKIILDHAEELGIGSKKYQLINID